MEEVVALEVLVTLEGCVVLPHCYLSRASHSIMIKLKQGLLAGKEAVEAVEMAKRTRAMAAVFLLKGRVILKGHSTNLLDPAIL